MRSPYAKALVGALIAALGVLGAGLDDGLTAGEWVTATVAALTALGTVYAVPNSGGAEPLIEQ